LNGIGAVALLFRFSEDDIERMTALCEATRSPRCEVGVCWRAARTPTRCVKTMEEKLLSDEKRGTPGALREYELQLSGRAISIREYFSRGRAFSTTGVFMATLSDDRARH